MKNKIAVIIVLFFGLSGFAVNPISSFGKKIKAESFELNIFTNQYYFPFVGIKNIVGSKYHPGISLGYMKDLKVKKRTTLYYDFRLGVYHHRFVQTGIQLYGNIGYRITVLKSFFVAGEFGLGYLHSIKHQSSFKPDSDGNYSKVLNLGRPQLMTGFGFKLGKQITIKEHNMRVFLNYQPWFQFPFVQSYVPLLPNNSFHIGIDFIFNES